MVKVDLRSGPRQHAVLSHSDVGDRSRQITRQETDWLVTHSADRPIMKVVLDKGDEKDGVHVLCTSSHSKCGKAPTHPPCMAKLPIPGSPVLSLDRGGGGGAGQGRTYRDTAGRHTHTT